MEKNEGMAGYVADDSLTLRLALKNTEDGGREYYRRDAEGGWKVIFDAGCPPCAAAASPEG